MICHSQGDLQALQLANNSFSSSLTQLNSMRFVEDLDVSSNQIVGEAASLDDLKCQVSCDVLSLAPLTGPEWRVLATQHTRHSSTCCNLMALVDK